MRDAPDSHPCLIPPSHGVPVSSVVAEPLGGRCPGRRCHTGTALFGPDRARGPSDEPDSQQAITDAYTSIGRELGATVAPAGIALQSFLRKHDQPTLHDKDGSHPTRAGPYLAACVFLAVLFKENPVGIDDGVPGLSAEERVLLQKTAWQASESIRSTKSKK
jgi:hypothetical protein